ncbi:MAG: tetratricopeptide repeat protein [Planctomycetia bacterium]|nr:tetratricopeptide repeat protein [Planctomycetia bacterium]
MKKHTIISVAAVVLAVTGTLCWFLNRSEPGRDMLQVGNEALLAGEWGQAAEAFATGLESQPENKELLFARAAALLAKAKDSYNLAAASASQGEQTRAEQEVAKADDGFTAARRDAERILELDPGFYQADYLLGCIDVYQGQWFAAIDRFTQVIKSAPEYAPAWQRRGEVYSQIGDVANAILDLKKAAALGYTNGAAGQDEPHADTPADAVDAFDSVKP